MSKNPTYIIDPTEWPKTLETERLENKAAILDYLNGFEPVVRASGGMVDAFTGEHVNLGAIGAYTDGKWCWDSTDVYYFEKYDAKLNVAFIADVA